MKRVSFFFSKARRRVTQARFIKPCQTVDKYQRKEKIINETIWTWDVILPNGTRLKPAAITLWYLAMALALQQEEKKLLRKSQKPSDWNPFFLPISARTKSHSFNSVSLALSHARAMHPPSNPFTCLIMESSTDSPSTCPNRLEFGWYRTLYLRNSCHVRGNRCTTS